MWGKRLLGVIGAAYLGGLISTSVADGLIYHSDNPLFAIRFSIFLLIFTVPGTLLVLAIYESARKIASGFMLHVISLTGGAAMGGLMTWGLSTGRPEAFWIGAYYGSVTAMTWVMIDRRWAAVR